jgi:hypothetical protein
MRGAVDERAIAKEMSGRDGGHVVFSSCNVVLRFVLAFDALGTLDQGIRIGRIRLGRKPCSGAEGATAPVNSQAQRTGSGGGLWRVVRAPAEGITFSGAQVEQGQRGHFGDRIRLSARCRDDPAF